MKLISMTDFVLEQMNEVMLDGTGTVCARLGNYAKFLKQPLKFIMFFAYDVNGQIIFEHNLSDSLYERQQIEKVLFSFPKGVHYPVDGSMDINYINSTKTETLFYYNEDLGYWKLTPFWEDKPIEHLIGLNIDLTPNAIKQLGL